MDHNEVTGLVNQYLHTLCVKIGARPTGSPQNGLAADYLYSVLQAGGLEVYRQTFPCIYWRGQKVVLKLGDKEIAAAISDYSPPCDVTAAYICIGTVEELARGVLEGKIAVLYGELTREAIMPKSFLFWNPEEHQRIVALLEAKNPAAIVTVSFKGLTPVFEDGDFKIPAAVVSRQDGEYLLHNSQQQMHLLIESFSQDVEAANIVANTGEKTAKIIISAHFDTKPNTPGATDNATGVACLLVLAKLLKQKGYDGGLEFVFFNGEDYFSAAGEVTYLDFFLKNRDDFRAVINIDGMGLKGSPTTVSFYNIEKSEEEAMRQHISLNHPDVEIIEPWYQGDHSIFTMNGLPGLALTSREMFDVTDIITHTPADNLEIVDAEIVAQTINLVEDLLKVCSFSQA